MTLHKILQFPLTSNLKMRLVKPLVAFEIEPTELIVRKRNPEKLGECIMSLAPTALQGLIRCGGCMQTAQYPLYESVIHIHFFILP